MEMALEPTSAGSQLAAAGGHRASRQSGHHGSPLKVTDPAAFARLVSQLRASSALQEEAASLREAERARREGAAYVPPHQRPTVESLAEPEASLGPSSAELPPVDATRDYYGDLGVDRSASAAELKAAFRRLALLYHPDKHGAAGAADQAAIGARFRAVNAAFAVLSHEASRAVYDKICDFRAASAQRSGLPTLTAAEAQLVAAGAAELRRLRRQGAKLGPHRPRALTLALSLAELDGGCTRALGFSRRRVDGGGLAYEEDAELRVVVPKGSRPGREVVFEQEGDETADTVPGDVHVTLQARPHPFLKVLAEADKDLECFGGLVHGESASCAPFYALWNVPQLHSAAPGDDAEARAAAAPTLAPRPPVPCPSPLAVSGSVLGRLLSNEPGCELLHRLPCQGLADPLQPWAQASRGSLRVVLRYVPPSRPPLLRLAGPGRRPILLVHDAWDAVGGALAGGALLENIQATRVAQEMWEEDAAEAAAAAALRIVVVSFSLPAAGGPPCAPASERMGPAAQALARVVQRRSACPSECTCVSLSPDAPWLDDEWVAVDRADVVVLDGGGVRAGQAPSAGLEELLWRRAWAGALVAATGHSVQWLGRVWDAAEGVGPASAPAGWERLLPLYALGAAGEQGDMEELFQALERSAGETGIVGIGLLGGGVTLVRPGSGTAEALAAPRQADLIGRARWAAGRQELEDADQDHGFLFAYRAGTS